MFDGGHWATVFIIHVRILPGVVAPPVLVCGTVVTLSNRTMPFRTPAGEHPRGGSRSRSHILSPENEQERKRVGSAKRRLDMNDDGDDAKSVHQLRSGGPQALDGKASLRTSVPEISPPQTPNSRRETKRRRSVASSTASSVHSGRSVASSTASPVHHSGTDRPALAEATTGRSETSLGKLTETFYEMLQATHGGTLDLNGVATELNVQKRRVYDITNVLEGIGLIEKKSKNQIQWKGASGREKFEALQAELAQLEENELILDAHREVMMKQMSMMMRDEHNKSMTYVDLNELTDMGILPDQALVGIRAPAGTRLEVPDPDFAAVPGRKRFEVYLKSFQGPMDIRFTQQPAKSTVALPGQVRVDPAVNSNFYGPPSPVKMSPSKRMALQSSPNKRLIQDDDTALAEYCAAHGIDAMLNTSFASTADDYGSHAAERHPGSLVHQQPSDHLLSYASTDMDILMQDSSMFRDTDPFHGVLETDSLNQF